MILREGIERMVEERGGEVYAGMLGLGGVAEGQLRSWPLQLRRCETKTCFALEEQSGRKSGTGKATV